ncbi:hypothetical protein [Nonomuraea dietziae]|uniref:hypothetical protein n=1 Tax=Nonomuraea dietziae TaxID=65515 RepID=UPI0031CF269E
MRRRLGVEHRTLGGGGEGAWAPSPGAPPWDTLSTSLAQLCRGTAPDDSSRAGHGSSSVAAATQVQDVDVGVRPCRRRSGTALASSCLAGYRSAAAHVDAHARGPVVEARTPYRRTPGR